MRFDKQVVLISGASRGIGRACALRVAREGGAVVVNYHRNVDAAESVVREVEELGSEAIAVQADVADPDAVSEMFETVRQRWGTVDALVVNAAASAFKDMVDVRPHHLEKTFALSIGGFVSLVQGALPLMMHGGRVVAIAGWDGFRVIPRHGVLGAAKSAMEHLVRQFAVELGPQGILVTGVSPGPVETDSAKFYSGDGWQDIVDAWAPSTPLGRFATPEDIAGVIGFLASRDNSWITGQTIVADGGLSLTTLPLER